LKNFILKSMKTIPPLPESVVEIERLFKDPESSIGDFARVIKKDPISSAVLLKAANSPMYGLKKIDNVDRAVAMFGKATSRAFVLQNAMRNSFEINLVPYSITPEVFSEVSQKRVFVMVRWYAKISLMHLNILSTVALIGNIGQVLISQAIEHYGKTAEFQALLKENSIAKSEKKLVGVTTEEVSAMLAEHWKLDPILANTIRYSTQLKDIPDDIFSYVLAYYVVSQTISLRGDMPSEDKLKKIRSFLEKYKLKPDHFMDVIEKL